MPHKRRAEYNAYLNSYMKRRWRVRRKVAAQLLGGACDSCGATDFLEFHHLDPESKINSIAKMSSASEERFWAEVNKCRLRCRPCHRQEHYGIVA